MTRAACLLLLTAACAGNSPSSSSPDGPGGGGDGPPANGPSAQAERFCAAVSACFGGVAECFLQLARYPDDFVGCASSAPDCIGVYACADTTVTEDPGCAESCQGNQAVTCQGTTRLEIDCAATFELGPACIEGAFGPVCAARACSADERGCAGNVLEICDVSEGVVKGFDCALHGWTCSETPAPRCSDGTAVACEGDVTRCDGNDLVECEGGFERQYDCAGVSAGMGCHTVGGVAFCGWGDDCDPTDAQGRETCAGTVMTYCAGGVLDTLDCAAYGHDTCREDAASGGSCE
jgi:hypothetical protein